MLYAGDMNTPAPFEIFLVVAPGLEPILCQEARQKGFSAPRPVEGGVLIDGTWSDVWRANLELRGATRVLARIDTFRAMHLAQLDKRARKVEWGRVLRTDVAVKVETTCKRSRIYHAGAASQRIETALQEQFGVTVSADAPVKVMVRIEDDLCAISVDTSGEALYKRGHKEAVSKAPIRETLASLFLSQCGYQGTEPVLDPMCGSGTFVIEAAEIAAGLRSGRGRQFAFEQLATFDDAAWRALRSDQTRKPTELRFFGSDRDAGAIRASTANAERAGVSDIATFSQNAVENLVAPEGPAGLVIVNPPYGTRIGNKKHLFGLYSALGQSLLKGFAGWRVGLITTDPALARATGLPFAKPGRKVDHGGLGVMLFQTKTLG